MDGDIAKLQASYNKTDDIQGFFVFDWLPTKTEPFQTKTGWVLFNEGKYLLSSGGRERFLTCSLQSFCVSG